MKIFREFTGKVAVVTGAGSGIGRACAQQLSACGASLALTDIDQAGLDETVASLPDSRKVTSYQFDVSHREAYQQFVALVIRDHGGVDIVINSAGIVRLHSIDQASYDDYAKSLDINVWGVLYGCKEFIPHLRKTSQTWLVNISSGAGLVGMGKYSSYNMTKFAVRGLTESLRNELRDTNISVSCVHPGGVQTNIEKSAVYSSDAQDAANRLAKGINQMTAADAVVEMLVGMSKKKKRILIGRDVKLIDKVARLFPTGYDWLLAKFF